ncbi:MAG: CCA tRNA nucleotidyltransferase [Hyphomonas sp.]|uniref:CCA tRNA nucleotidyltransferase n=1 Tax=Hyphomonas sp. TaxID=87 RepID=UPI00181C3A91|nr:CCA tRNA nucleotidyltransferase [Hyphomonas sp.]MBU3919275.1 CCA tRNA nucleotidyltransferase [Alphaproteobacteria bacterium]MBA3068478.1 CCA tRNA nucleotidyltransferase [Hyphomonas sp.]MBU4060655.1 CCA tRNA nucleotidyltransferase [Alphaproteobacteria bacterium]MBU4164639.1 CCA tRNA nucleotidyltransferase [Alphaproteobacteria bacterium]MBU4567893.1 CCA tRNA nucleotidyltransferase [Alphaproteobacteria bacterium]
MSLPDILEAPWLTAPANLAVFGALEAARPGGSRYVGGCVRNTLRGLPSDDFDVATQLTPASVIAALKAAGVRAVPTGIEHGTVTAVHAGQPVEITTLRRDVETDGRRAVVAFTEDWREDAGRRDFRLNAIYASPDGTLHEIIPGSIDDAVAGRVIFIGDADQRLREDYLRILRFYRFNAWYGAGIDAGGQAACARQREGLRRIAAERIWKELKRTLAAPDPSHAMDAMEEAGVLSEVLPGASPALLPALVAAETGARLAPDPMRRLVALVPRRLREAGALSARLKLSNEESGRLAGWADPALPHVLGAGEAAAAEAFYRHGAAAVVDRAVIEAASGAAGNLAGLVGHAAAWQRPKFPVGGADALSAGLEGPGIGAALSALEEDWIASGFSLDRRTLIARLKAFS